ncbi:MAG: O-methyltransferase, partial [Thermodesulfobacteriota bacterium]
MKKIGSEIYIVNPDIEEYLRGLAPVEDEVLREMEELGRNRDFPIIGPLVGRLLYQLAVMIGAKRVFDMGSGFGYSAYWFAKALGEGGFVVYTDLSEKNARSTEEFFRRGGLREKIRINIGDSRKILEETEEEFDIVFNDIDKEQYPFVVDIAHKRLRKGGLFITDNVLWYGRILTEDTSSSTKGVKEFTSLLLSQKGFLTTIIPIRDGISL